MDAGRKKEGKRATWNHKFSWCHWTEFGEITVEYEGLLQLSFESCSLLRLASYLRHSWALGQGGQSCSTLPLPPTVPWNGGGGLTSALQPWAVLGGMQHCKWVLESWATAHLAAQPEDTGYALLNVGLLHSYPSHFRFTQLCLRSDFPCCCTLPYPGKLHSPLSFLILKQADFWRRLWKTEFRKRWYLTNLLIL